jgi:hypothetical protein
MRLGSPGRDKALLHGAFPQMAGVLAKVLESPIAFVCSILVVILLSLLVLVCLWPAWCHFVLATVVPTFQSICG